MAMGTTKRIITCSILMVLLSMMLVSCNEAPSALEQDLTATLTAICNSNLDESSYIYGETLRGENGSGQGENNDIAEKIASLVTFEVADISEGSDTATAKIKLTSPDVYLMIAEIASELQKDNVEALLDILDNNLDGDYAVKEYEIAVDLKLINEHWYLIPNGELANAFSGGIVEQFSMMGQNIINNLIEEGE